MIVESKPDDALAPRWQAFNRRGLAWVLSRQQRHKEAIQELERALKLQAWVVAKDPKDPQFQEELGVILSALGEERGRVGDTVSAAGHLHRAVSILVPLRQASPHKLALLRDLGHCYERLGNLAAANSDWSEARSWYAKSQEMWNTWPTIAPSTRYDLTENDRVTRLLEQAEQRARGARTLRAQDISAKS